MTHQEITRHWNYQAGIATAILCGLLAINTNGATAADTPKITVIPIPGGTGGIGFDDMGYSPDLKRVVVPAGRTGAIALVDPESHQIQLITGFSSGSKSAHSHDEGVTSADVGKGIMLATDHSSKTIDVVDLSTMKIVATAPLASDPDYVRYVAPTDEAWVTEPDASRIEVFSLPSDGTTTKPVHSGFISIPGGPEALLINEHDGLAYSNLWKNQTVVIDLKKRAIVDQWPNGCADSRGLAMDSARVQLFVGCKEGKLSVLDLKAGKPLGEATSGSGVDIIAYNPKLKDVYLPGAKSATLAVIEISGTGEPKIVGTVPTAKGAHCAAFDDRGQVYVCDPHGGRLLMFEDSFTATK
jgi:hypothetical protein